METSTSHFIYLSLRVHILSAIFLTVKYILVEVSGVIFNIGSMTRFHNGQAPALPAEPGGENNNNTANLN